MTEEFNREIMIREEREICDEILSSLSDRGFNAQLPLEDSLDACGGAVTLEEFRELGIKIINQIYDEECQ